MLNTLIGPKDYVGGDFSAIELEDPILAAEQRLKTLEEEGIRASKLDVRFCSAMREAGELVRRIVNLREDVERGLAGRRKVDDSFFNKAIIVPTYSLEVKVV
jgi:hypothetical protein